MFKSLISKLFGFYKETKQTYEQKLDEEAKDFLGVEESLQESEKKSPKKSTSKPKVTKSTRKKKSD